jgi:ketosteroid isomerase-like protein
MRLAFFPVVWLLGASAALAADDPLVAVVDLKFLKETEQVTAIMCYGLAEDGEGDCHPWAYGYLWEARLRRTISGKPAGKTFLVLYGRHALPNKDLRGVVGKFSRLEGGTDGAQYQMVRAVEGKPACFEWFGRDGSGPAEQPESGALLHCYDPEHLPEADRSSPLADPEQSLRIANEAYNQAIINADVAALEKIFAPEFLYTTTAGQVLDKAAQLELFRSKRLAIETGKGSDERIQIHGKIGIVTGRFDATGNHEGKPFEARERYTSVWRIRQDRWQLVSEQGTLIR